MSTEKPQTVKAADILNTEMPAVTGAPVAPETPKPETAPKAGPETGIPHNGRNYDPAKFRTNPDGTLALNKHGQPMPKGGRKKGNGATVTPPSGSFIPPEMPPPPNPEMQPDAGPEEMGNGAKPEMPAASAKSVAEVATNAGYAITGAIIRDHKAARPSVAEHANLRDTTAAYIEARGIKFIGGVAVGFGVLAYLLGEERRGAILETGKRLWAVLNKPKPKDVTPPPANGTAAQPAAKPAEQIGQFKTIF